MVFIASFFSTVLITYMSYFIFDFQKHLGHRDHNYHKTYSFTTTYSIYGSILNVILQNASTYYQTESIIHLPYLMSIFGEMSVVHGCTPPVKSNKFTITVHMHHSQSVHHVDEHILLLCVIVCVLRSRVALVHTTLLHKHVHAI